MNFKKELKIGIFVVVVLVASFFVINYLRGKDIFNNEVEVVADFDNVDGLAVSAPVTVQGFKAGKVTAIDYISAERYFRVTCSVLNDFAIPEDSKMTIYPLDLMGAKGVKIELGVSEKMLEDGDVIEASHEGGMFEGFAGQITPVIAKVNNTLDSLTATMSSVNKLLSDANQAHIANTLALLEKTMKDISTIASVIEGRSDEIDLFITNLSELSVKLNAVADKVDGTVDGMTGVVAEIQEADIKGVVESFHALLNNINDPDGSIGKLIVDGSVYDSLDTLLTDIDTLVNKIQENPKKYMKFSIF